MFAPRIFTRFFRLFNLGNRKRKPIRPVVCYTRLRIDELEKRDCPSSAPVIENLVLNTTTPLTNDIIGPSFTTTDGDGDSVSYDYVWRVNGNVIRTTTTNLPYDPYHLYYGGYGDKGQTVKLSVTPWDANDRGATVVVSATVQNSAPVIYMGNVWTFESFRGDAVSLQINATDDDGDTLTFDPPIGLPPGLSMSSAGLITGTILASANTTTPYSLTVTTSDGSLTDTTTFSWNITQPTVTLVNPGNQSLYHNVLSGVWITASTNTSHALTYSIASATPLPNGLSLDAPYPDLISGTMPITAVSATPYTVTVIATDVAAGVSASQTFTITVLNHAPTIDGWNLSAVQSYTGDVVSLQIYATDDDYDSLTFNITGLPPGLGYNSGTGAITGTVSMAANTETPYTVWITINDGKDSDTRSFVWTVGASAELLYDRYLAAVAAADVVYLAAVADRDGAINSARADAQSGADGLYAAYLTAIAGVEANYGIALAHAQAAYDSAIAGADAVWTTATASSRATYDAAITSAQITLDSALASLRANFEAAIAIADAAYDGTVAPYQIARDAALEATYNTAEAALTAATSTAESQRQTAYAAADAVGQTGADTAQAAFDDAVSDAEAGYQNAIAVPNDDWTNTKTAAQSSLTSASDAAAGTLLANEVSAWTSYSDGVDGIDAALALTESGINDGYEPTVIIANSEWATSEASAWEIYATAMAALPDSPKLGDRVSAPPTDVFLGTDKGDRVDLFTQLLAPITITAITIVAPAGGVPADGTSGTYTATITGATAANTTRRIWWGVFDGSTAIVRDQSVDVLANGAGDFSATVTFALFSNRAGNVSSIHANGSRNASIVVRANAGTRFLLAGSFASAATAATGTVAAPLAWRTTGDTGTTYAIAVTHPVANTTVVAGQPLVTLVASSIIPVTSTFTLTVTGTPNTVVTNLRWSVVETNSLPLRDTLVVAPREFSVTIGAGGTGVYTGSFILFVRADLSGTYTSGVDAIVGDFDNPTDDMYVWITPAGLGSEKIRSATFKTRWV